jgi:hypothetical protein
MQAFDAAVIRPGQRCAREDVITSVTEAGKSANHQLYGTHPKVYI